MRTCAIVLDYCNADMTSQCLKSLIGQQLSKVYIVDNNPDEASSIQLKSAVHRFAETTNDYETQIIGKNSNLGFASGVNFAIRTDLESASPHDYYLLINNDATAKNGLVLRLHQALLDADTLLATPCILVPNNKSLCSIWYNRYLGIVTSRKTPLSFNFVSGCCMLLSKQLVKDGALFDTDFFMYGEDAILCWRLSREGTGFTIADDTHVSHDVGGSSRKSGLFYEYHTARWHILMAVKAFRHPLEVPLMLVTRFASLAVRMVVRCLRYRSAVPAIAFTLAWLPVRLRMTP